MYVLTDGVRTEQFEAAIPYRAVQMFIDKHGADIKDISIRTFGGKNYPAVTYLPRSRRASSKTNKEDVQLVSGDGE